MTATTLFNLLHSDHCRLDDLLLAYQESKSKDFDKAYSFFMEFRKALLRHFAGEEEILFPAYDTIICDASDETTSILKSEHRQMLDLLNCIYEKLQKRDINTVLEEERLICLHHDHALEEDKIMYPVMDQLLTDQERESVVNRIMDLSRGK
ncbi:MAG: hemerythrin domain-containing protein [Chlamydiota bacterium]|nr:hemerythrin domain-containing protein [Chlamydiota bacterium]